MAKKSKRPSHKESIASKPPVAVNGVNKLSLALIFLYLGVELVPKFGAIDIMGPQWVYLSVLNLISAIYIFTSLRGVFGTLLTKLSRNAISIALIIILFFCGISGFFALNPVESLVVYVRLAITVIAFFNICILLYGQTKTIEYIFQAVSLLVLIQCFPSLFAFVKEIGSKPMDSLISSLGTSSGNKNVLAAALVIKLPFVIYCAFRYFSLGRYAVNASSLLLVSLMIFLLNARAAYLAVFLQIFIYLIFLIMNKRYVGLKQSLRYLFIVLIPVLIGLGVSQLLLSNRIDANSANYTTLGKRLSTISADESSSSARLFFWENALKQIKETPLTGVGYGNWKIASVKYENEFYNDFNYSKHAHNDFLEMAAESGIIAALLFLSIFVLALIYTLKTWYSELSNELKIISVFSLMALAGYFVDACLNFPAERPVMQIYLVFTLAVNVLLFINSKSRVEAKPFPVVFKAVIFSLGLALMMTSIYVGWQTYKSMVTQSLTHFDFATPQKRVTWNDIDSKFPDIPNLAESNIPVNHVKAWYLLQATRYPEALKLLDEDVNANPYSGSREWLKASVFSAMNLPDSALLYSEKGFSNRPRNIALFSTLIKVGISKRDPLLINSTFKSYNKYRDEPEAWRIYIRALLALQYDKARLLHISDSISALYPTNKELQHTKFFVRAGTAALSQNYQEALRSLREIEKINPADHENMENIGLTLYSLNDFAGAAQYFRKVIDAKAYQNGKSEFFLANSLVRLGRKEEACSYLSIAVSRNFPGATQWYKTFMCK